METGYLCSVKVSGFTFIRNALEFDYPVVEAIQSILPICDEVVVAVGNSKDATLELIRAIPSDKIRILETVWDDALREGGRVLAVETDKAFAAIDPNSDWAFYIQGDEVVHEKDLPAIQQAMQEHLHQEAVDGLLFAYRHFYGSYDYEAVSSNFYKNEIRIIRNNKTIYSYRDAQGFRKNENEKLQVKRVDATMFHYGWVRDPRAMQRKQESFQKLWHDDEWVKNNVIPAEFFDYNRHIRELKKFEGTHPESMLDRIARSNWVYDTDIAFRRRSLKDHFKNQVFKLTGIDINYKNYKLI